MQFEKMAIDK